MSINIDPTQASTKRGAIWLTVGIVGMLMLLTGHKEDVSTLVVLGGTIAGGLGVAIKD